MILAKDIPVALTMVPMAFNQDMKAIIPGPSLDPRFLLYSLVHNKRRLIPEIGTSAHGTKRIGTSAITSFSIAVPLLDEQRQIASALRAVDQKLNAEEARGQALSSLFSSLLHNLMTGKLRVHDLALPTSMEAAP